MKALLSLLLLPLSSLHGADYLNFFELDVVEHGSTIRIDGSPRPLVSYDTLEQQDLHLSDAVAAVSLDAPLRQLSLLLARLGPRNEDIFADAEMPPRFELVNIQFDVFLRQLSGKKLGREQFTVKVFLENKPDEVIFSSKFGEYRLSTRNLASQDAYIDFLHKLIFPEGSFSFQRPIQNDFLVDLRYTVEKTSRPPLKEVPFDGESSFDILTILKSHKLKIHLGTTFCRRQNQQLTLFRSDYLRFYKDSMDEFTRVLDETSDHQTRIDHLERYTGTFPSDRKALSLLIDLYIEAGEIIKADHLMQRMKPIFTSLPGGLENQIYLGRTAAKIKKEMLARRSDFNPGSATLEILSPTDGDLIAGRTWLEFDLHNQESPVLQIDCFLDGQRFTSLTDPPYLVSFQTPDGRQPKSLKVTAWFENETFAESEIQVTPFRVDSEEAVNLVSLRTVVTRSGRSFLTDLEETDFAVKENGRKRKISGFSRDHSPLNVAFLVDASLSMNGKKLHKSQYAIKSFLEKLGEQDKASIYTFERNVLRLTDYTNDFQSTIPKLMTLTPKLTTSLYDAIYIAHTDLMRQQGTKVMIIVSDGEDSNSSVTSSQIMSMLGKSSVLVYPIIINLSSSETVGAGARFLQRVAGITGSIATEVRRISALDDTFARIYEELRSFYFINFYTFSNNIRIQDIEVDVRKQGRGVSARFRKHQGPLYQ